MGEQVVRMRRLRKTPWIREILSENRLYASDLIYPLFVIEGESVSQKVASMPGVERYSIDLLVSKAREAANLGIQAIALFPVVDPALKCAEGKEALNAQNLACRAIKAIKENVPEIGVIADVALDPYTSHGHDGLVEDGHILNDETVVSLSEQAVLLANAGADIVAPSDMMDGRVRAIRKALDCSSNQNVSILSYAAKFASAYYGPFRDAVGSSGALKGDKKTYQMNPANAVEAMREIALDIDEGADFIMIKPGLPYLDIISASKQRFDVPVFAYHVSGEYTMLKLAEEHGVLDYDRCLIECLFGFKRAGCSGIITYGALDAARLLGN
ncbi:MAG: porphobilinogen synthase [Micavibrio sp.]|nr:porphobilinogen synthase [Micavibrio sp.]